MIKGAVPKGWHLKPPPRYGAESANTSYSPVHTAKTTLSHAFGVATCINPHKEKEPGTQIASRLSLWLRRSVWIVIGIVPPKGRGRLCGNRPCGEQFSSVPHKQDEAPKCNLSPSEERQAAATGFHLKLLHQKKEYPLDWPSRCCFRLGRIYSRPWESCHGCISKHPIQLPEDRYYMRVHLPEAQ